MAKQRYFVACAFSVLACALVSPAAAQVGGDPRPVGSAGQSGAQTGADATLGSSSNAASSNAVQNGSPDIIVTGSLIRGSSEDAAAPVDVISGDELAKQGAPTAVELLKNLPTSNGVTGDANQFDSRSQGNEGVASVNLRGLGPQRTLVLLNGKRLVPVGGGIPIVDINLIPSGAIGRVEVLKDGAAATYGSDAIAGVVNFITRTDQKGFLVSGDYRYIDGSKGDYGTAISYGHSGNGFRMLASFGYQHRSELRTTDRDFTIQPYANNPQGGWTGAATRAISTSTRRCRSSTPQPGGCSPAMARPARRTVSTSSAISGANRSADSAARPGRARRRRPRLARSRCRRIGASTITGSSAISSSPRIAIRPMPNSRST
ncbi:TonB-dependent receptor plug domain-containing protein [Sphingomonas sp. 22R3R2A-7]|uniref:TonB-dependent receptor plug domain-containing protein n=1 Tax=Sphingomonas sp. 22R3R2A-7 TaxID=3050230 RepID=UPI002FE0F4C4